MKKKMLWIGAAVAVVAAVWYFRTVKPQNWGALTLRQKLEWLALRLRASRVDGAQFE